MNGQYAQQKRYKQMLVARGICIECLDFNDTSQLRCTRCKRRIYVRQRIKQVARALDYYKREMSLLMREDRAWRRAQERKHAKPLQLASGRQWQRSRRGSGQRHVDGRWAA